jgi:phosphoesterase RecJ-like protein
MTSRNGSMTSREQVLAELRGADKLVLVTHENPDGDALGSLVAMHGVPRALGKDSLMFMGADEFPLPYEYRFFVLDGLVSEAPADMGERTGRLPGLRQHRPQSRRGRQARRRAHPQHRPPPRQHALRHGRPCGGGRLLHGGDRVGPHARPRRRADADDRRRPLRRARDGHGPVHVREHRHPRAHHGRRAHRRGRGRQRDLPAPVRGHAVLQARAALARLANIRRYDDGRLAFTRLAREDFEEAGAEESYSEGIIDHLRSVQGTKVAAMARELLDPGKAGRTKVSLRATDGEVDVSVIARAGGGGGHRQAAGFTTLLDPDELVAFLRDQVATQLGPTAPAVPSGAR